MSEYDFLSAVNSPADVKKINEDDLPYLCSEIREFICDAVKENGGHLASNLGTVELTVALHRAFDFPNDHLIFDVGHQSYTHKILTGRKDGFATLRKRGGMSGFTKMSESEYDCFGAGHSSTSVSAAIGFAEAERLKGSDNYTVAVLGDGAFTGGMVHEALNNCRKDLKLIIILNENDMSISKNIGSFAKLIAKIRASKKYYKTKRTTVKVIKHIPLIGNPIYRGMKSLKQSIKNKMFKSNYFEDLGLYYLGPVDGHNCKKLGRLFDEAKNANQSTVIHVRTVKGRGYMPAEKDPGKYHAVAPSGAPKFDNFSSKMGEVLSSLAEKDGKVCAVTAAMAVGTGLTEFEKKHKDRFFDVGIAEEHALTFCAGLAANGFKPYFAVYSSFLQRGYDNVVHDIALQNLPVTILIDRAGISEGDGATHHGIFDVSFLSAVPNMSIYAPADFSSLEEILNLTLKEKAPIAVRYSNSPDIPYICQRFIYGNRFARCDFEKGAELEYLIITYGKIVSEAVKACDILREQGKKCGIVLLEKLKPCYDAVSSINSYGLTSLRKAVFLEEGIKNGSAGMIISPLLSFKTEVLAIDDCFDTPKVTGNIYSDFGIGCEDLLKMLVS